MLRPLIFHNNDNRKHRAVSCEIIQCGKGDQQSLRSACANAQSDQSHCISLEYSMSVKLLTKHLLEFLSLKRGCTCSSESTLVKMPNCWKSHVMAYTCMLLPVEMPTWTDQILQMYVQKTRQYSSLDSLSILHAHHRRCIALQYTKPIHIAK